MICAATTRTGRRCKKHAMAGSDLCSSHLRRTGRKVGLTVKLTDDLVSMLRGGVPVRTAIAALNVPKSTYYGWLESEHPLCQRFAERTEEARAFGEAQLVSRIARASTDSWQAAAWLLERTVPETYARLTQRTLVPVEKPENPFREFVDDELARRRKT